MRVKGRKSRTDGQKPQRKDRFTAAQIAWMDRDQERLYRAREKEKKRIANKKKKAEKEAKEREARKRQGIPDPDVLPVPSSQPLLSKFLAKPKSKPESAPSVVTTESGNDDGGMQSDGGDTEPCTPESIEELDNVEAAIPGDHGVAVDPTDDLDCNNNAGSTKDTAHNNDVEVQNGARDEDEDAFSECSVFYDEDFIREAETAVAQGQGQQKTPQSPQAQPMQCPPTKPAARQSFREAKAVATAQSHHSQQKTSPQTQPIQQPPAKPAVEESFRDDTADFLEEFAPDADFERGLLQLNAG